MKDSDQVVLFYFHNGKTATATRASKSQLYMQDPDKAPSYLAAADTKPSLLLKGDTPRLLDAWQSAPVPWDAVRFMVGQRGGSPGQFILTCSAVPQVGVVKHTGTGRISCLTMRPMSLCESLESKGGISLRDLFDGKNTIECHSDLSMEKLLVPLLGEGGLLPSEKRERLPYAVL